MPNTFTILAVCTGNICRSPAVERLLATHLGPGVQVRSAGVRAVVGAPVPAPMTSLLAGDGVDAGGFAARQLTPAMLQESNLVLALTRDHRSRIVDLYPGAVRRTFTLRELARLVDGIDPATLEGADVAQRLTNLLPLAAAQRGQRGSVPDDDDVVDPYGHGDDVYARSYAELTTAVNAITAVLRP